MRPHISVDPESKVNGANMGPIYGREDPGGPHVGPMNFAIWAAFHLAAYVCTMATDQKLIGADKAYVLAQPLPLLFRQ